MVESGVELTDRVNIIARIDLCYGCHIGLIFFE